MANEVELEKVARSVFGITSRRYRQMASEGVVPVVVKGKIDFVAAAKAVIEYYRKLAEGQGSISLIDERAALTAIKKEREKLKLETERGNLVPKEQSLIWLSKLLAEIKLHFLGLPRRLVGSLIILKDEREVESVLKHEITRILWTLSKPLPQKERRKKPRRRAGRVKARAKAAR